MPKENTCNYSDEWQPYINRYDKFEYDVKLHDGRVIENCYPNTGVFDSVSGEMKEMDIREDQISEIRFSQHPLTWLNENVSSVIQPDYIERDRVVIARESKPKLIIMAHANHGSTGMLFSNERILFNEAVTPAPQEQPSYYDIKDHPLEYWAQRRIPVRTEPKIQRNEPCKCGSGLKFKKCCINK